MTAMDHKKLQRASGYRSGVYLFCDGLTVFVPQARESAMRAALILTSQGDTALRNIIERALEEAHPVVPGVTEGTHGAGPKRS